MDISSLSPDNQQAFLALLGQQNQQSMDPSSFISKVQGQSPATAPSAAPDDVNARIAMDMGIHPAQQNPVSAGPDQAPPAPVQQGGSAPYQVLNKDGVFYAQAPNTAFLGKLLGIKNATRQLSDPTNYYATAKRLADEGIPLPDNLPVDEKGKPFVTADHLKQMLYAKSLLPGISNPRYSTKEELTSMGLPEDVADKMLAANKDGVSQKQIGVYQAGERLKATNEIADARATTAGVLKLSQALKIGGFDAAQPAAQAAVKNLGLAQRAQQTIDQIMQAGGVANQQQRATLSADLAQIAGNSQGVLTDQRMNEFMPQSAMAKYGNWQAYWTNKNEPVNFTGFLPQLQDLLTKEVTANRGIAAAASQLGLDIAQNTGAMSPRKRKQIEDARAANPIVGGSGSTGQVKTASDYMSKFNNK